MRMEPIGINAGKQDPNDKAIRAFSQDLNLWDRRNVVAIARSGKCDRNRGHVNATIAQHLARLCTAAKRAGPGPPTAQRLLDVFADAVVREDAAVVGCSCGGEARAKGFEIGDEWFGRRELNHSYAGGSDDDDDSGAAVAGKPRFPWHRFDRVVWLDRPNLFARYVSMRVAIATGEWHPRTAAERARTRAARITLDVAGKSNGNDLFF